MQLLLLTKIIKIQVPHGHTDIFLERQTKNITKIYLVPRKIIYRARAKCLNRKLSTKYLDIEY